MSIIRKLASRSSPVGTTFTASLLLSLIAWLNSTVNRDGMLYVKAATAFGDGGFSAAKEVFNWPFLPVAMGVVSQISGLSPETAGYVLNAFFMAGACALMVACIESRQREIAWAACLTVLALPGLNEYRNELLREFGCWFFVMLALWLAQRWSNQPRWKGAFVVQAALGTAALFRPEALALFPALIAWQWFEAPSDERRLRLMMLGALPFVGATLLGVLYFGGELDHSGRLAGEFNRISTARFDAKAQALAGALIEYAHDQARTVLFFGSLALIPVKLFQKFGPFLLPLAAFIADKDLRQAARQHALMTWAIVAHLLVLAVFVLDVQFLAGRYVGLILLFSTPFSAAGLMALIRRIPRARYLMIALTMAVMLSNVVSTSPGKTHLVEAGRWLSSSTVDASRIYIDSGRTAYHAGWLSTVPATRNDRTQIEQAVSSGNYDLFVLEVSRKDTPIGPWFHSIGLSEIKRFDSHSGDAVVIASATDNKVAPDFKSQPHKRMEP